MHLRAGECVYGGSGGVGNQLRIKNEELRIKNVAGCESVLLPALL